MTRSGTPESPPDPRIGAMESISSKNRIHGAAERAFLKISRTPRSDSPTYLERSCGPLTEIKFAWTSFASVNENKLLFHFIHSLDKMRFCHDSSEISLQR